MSVVHNLVSQLNVGESSPPRCPSALEDVDILMFDEKEAEIKVSSCEGYPYPEECDLDLILFPTPPTSLLSSRKSSLM